MSAKKPMALVFLDGWGYREDNANNAINNARTPVMDSLMANNPHTLISASGMDVGLPDGQMGNSEVGHTNIGAGRIVYQDLTRITKAIMDGEFQHNEVLLAAIDKAVAAGKAVHLMGLMSPGGVHSHEYHIYAAVEMAAARGPEKSTCTASLTVVTHHHVAQKRHRNASKNGLPNWVKAVSLLSWVITTPWIVTKTGIALKSL